jgi:hypothetical protein
LFLNCNVLHLQYLNNNMSKDIKRPHTIRWGDLFERILKAAKKYGLTVSGYVKMAVSIQLDKDGF